MLIYIFHDLQKGQEQDSSAKNRAECQQHTDDLNATHFQFGTDLNGWEYLNYTLHTVRNPESLRNEVCGAKKSFSKMKQGCLLLLVNWAWRGKFTESCQFCSLLVAVFFQRVSYTSVQPSWNQKGGITKSEEDARHTHV